MATVTRPTDALPDPGDALKAEPVRDHIANILTFIESNNIDSSNVDYSSTDGIMVLDQAQTVTGAKNFSTSILLSGSAIVDLNGIADSLVLDEDADTTISAPTDDQIDIEVGGADLYKFTATAFVSGSNIVSDTTNTDSLGTTALTWSDLYLGDSSVLAFGEDQDVTLTHDPDDGIFINAGMKLAFRDMGGEYIYSVSDGTLGIVAATEVDITTTTLDVNGAVDISGATAIGGTLNVGSSTAIANVKDEDNMSSDSATSLSTQQSIKAYVDSQVETMDTLAELTDTNITSAADASMLLYDTGTSRWIDNIMSGDATMADTGAVTFAGTNTNLTTLANVTTVGTIGTGAWESSTVVASAYLDAQTAHLNVSQSFTGAKTFGAATQFNSTVTVGVDDTGYDVKFFGAAAGAYLEWDQSANQLRIMGAEADATTSTGKLLLATSLTDINANDVLGKIDFQAPHESDGTDATTIAASIQAVAQGTFSALVNATDLIFYTGHSEAATEKFRFTSQGEIGIGGANYGSDGQVLTSAGANLPPAWETPAAASGDVTGITSIYNASLKMGRDSQNLIDFATTDDKIILRVANVDEVELVANVLQPTTSDGVALGTASLMWSDLFLASGSVVNFHNGDITLTHSSNTLTVAGGTLAAAAITGTTIDAATDFTIGDTVITDGVITDSSGLSVAAATTVTGALTVGVDDTGHDVKFFGAAAGAYMEWDESVNQLRIVGPSADATTSTGKLLLATSLNDINANDVIGKIEFQAPLEVGADAISVSASIKAIAQSTFTGSSNATDIVFSTGHSETATEKFRITSQGELGIGGANYGSDGQVLTSTGAGTAPAWEAAASSGHTIQEEGSGLTARANLNFVGAGVTATDDSGNSATKVTIGATAASMPLTRSDGSTSDPIALTSAAVGESLVSDTTPQLGGSLDVNGQSIVTASNGNVQMTPNGTGSVLVGVDDTGHDVKFFGATAGNNMLWDQSADTLYINAADANYSQLKFGATSEANYGIIRADYDDSLMEIGINKSGGKLGFYTNTFTQAMLIDNAGNVGIGNAAPAGKLHIEQPTDAAVGLRIEQNDSTGSNPNAAPMWIQGTNLAGTNTYFAMSSAGIYTAGISYVGRTVKPAQMTVGVAIDQGTNDNDILSFKSTGDVSHTLTDITEADTYGNVHKLSATLGGLFIRGQTETNSAIEIHGLVTTETNARATTATGPIRLVATRKADSGNSNAIMNGDQNMVVMGDGNNTRFIFDSDGDGHADSSWTTYSDSRLKTNVINCPYGLAEVLQLQPKKFDRHSGKIEDGKVVLEDNARSMIGFLAQDVKALMPELVKDVDTTESFYSMEDGKLAAVLVNAIKELNDKLEAN